MKILCALFAVLSVMASTSQAAVKFPRWNEDAKKTTAQQQKWVDDTFKALAAMNEADEQRSFDQLVEAAKEQEKLRRPAAQTGDPYQRVKDELWKCKTSADFAGFINRLNADYEADEKNVGGKSDRLTPEEKLFTIHVQPIRAFRGFFFKIKKLFDNRNHFKNGSAFLHSRLVTFARRLAERFSIHLPTDHMQAVIDYFAAPYEDSRSELNQFETWMKPQADDGYRGFKDEGEMQRWLYSRLAPELMLSIARLGSLPLGTQPLSWDNQVIYGNGSFADAQARKRTSFYGLIERQASLVCFFMALHDLDLFSAYSLDHYIDYMVKVGHLYGIDSFESVVGRQEVDGVFPEDISKVANGFHELGRLSTKDDGRGVPDGKTLTQLALKHAVGAVHNFRALWKMTDPKSGVNQTDHNLVQAGFFNIRRSDKEETLKILAALFPLVYLTQNPSRLDLPPTQVAWHSVEIRSTIYPTKVIRVNVEKLYMKPPEDLKAFLMTDGRPAGEKTFAVGKQKIAYRDYREGNAWEKSWSPDALSKYHDYFPSVSGGADVINLRTVLHEVKGFWSSLGKVEVDPSN